MEHNGKREYFLSLPGIDSARCDQVNLHPVYLDLLNEPHYQKGVDKFMGHAQTEREQKLEYVEKNWHVFENSDPINM